VTRLRYALLVAAFSLVASTAAQTQDPQPPDNYLIAEHVPRFALAVGVENYDHFDRVPNALNDLDVAVNAFQAAGFGTVMAEPNPTADRLRTALRQISQLGVQSGRPAVVTVFFAGHGFQNGPNNYIVPKDAKPATLVEDSVPVSNILSRLARTTTIGASGERISTGVTFVFLDACRTLSPLVRAGRPGDADIPVHPGFAQAASFVGMIQMFAAKWGQAALSRVHQADHNSPYSEALRRFLNRRGDNISTTYSNVFEWVTHRTPFQEPEILAIGSIDKIRFMPLSDFELEAEDRHWRDTLATRRADCVKKFVRAYPDSRYVVPALRWLTENPSASTNTAGGDECPQR
jgi:hypothetical protein